MTHPRLEYLLVALVAAGFVFVLTPVAQRIAERTGAIAKPRDRDVHAVAIPRLGGMAIFVGAAVALFVASRLPALQESFNNGPDMPWMVIAAGILCLLGIIDDRIELDSVTKLAGQVLACAIMTTLGGVQVGAIGLPWGGGETFVLGRDLSIPVTILFTVLTINAMNFIDGLDGLATGVTVIAALGTFAYSYHLAEGLGFADIAAPPMLLAAVIAGAAAGFLPHNFYPARIFMGDSGSMVLGMFLSAATVSATTTTDPQAFNQSYGSLPLFLPLLIPVMVLALPLVDLLLAVVRRVSRGRSPFAPDKQHLHHRLLEIGHSHRRAVLLLYFWSATVAFAGVGITLNRRVTVVVTSLAVLAGLGVALSIVPSVQRRIARRRRRTADLAGRGSR